MRQRIYFYLELGPRVALWRSYKLRPFPLSSPSAIPLIPDSRKLFYFKKAHKFVEVHPSSRFYALQRSTAATAATSASTAALRIGEDLRPSITAVTTERHPEYADRIPEHVRPTPSVNRDSQNLTESAAAPTRSPHVHVVICVVEHTTVRLGWLS